MRSLQHIKCSVDPNCYYFRGETHADHWHEEADACLYSGSSHIILQLWLYKCACLIEYVSCVQPRNDNK